MTQEPQVKAHPPAPGGGATVDNLSTPPPADVTDYQRSVALTWVRRGLHVIPCSRTEKRPLLAGFGADATAQELAPFCDPDTVAGWWSGRYKRAHVGILTRALVVIDLDMPKDSAAPLSGRWAGCQGGTDVLELLAAEAGAQWPDTYTVMTPSGGLHLYFVQPEGEPIGCATGAGQPPPYDRPVLPPHLGPLVDVRGVGGLVIAAGSYSAAQGRAYTRISPAPVRPAPLPGWLLGLLRPAAPPLPEQRPAPVLAMPSGDRAERYATAALNGAAEDVAGAPEGERNRLLFAAARRLGELSATAPAVLTEATVREQLLAAAAQCGLDGGERAALRTIRSGWERGTAQPMGGAA